MGSTPIDFRSLIDAIALDVSTRNPSGDLETEIVNAATPYVAELCEDPSLNDDDLEQIITSMVREFVKRLSDMALGGGWNSVA